MIDLKVPKYFHRDLEMANHLGTYILPIVNDEELAKLFWNIYAQKPYKEKKVSFWCWGHGPADHR